MKKGRKRKRTSVETEVARSTSGAIGVEDSIEVDKRTKVGSASVRHWSKYTRFPYEVDYNDHFETPREAYLDILPLLRLLAPSHSNSTTTKTSGDNNGDNLKNDNDDPVLYDPYYCNGRTKELLEGPPFMFQNVQHYKRDFYKDIQMKNVPQHDTLITNPPYSSDHKIKCLNFAVSSLRSQCRPFFLLMPNYVVTKDYYSKATFVKCPKTGILKEADDIVYIVPDVPYEYDHPEGTGKEIPPFTSMWFCGVGSQFKERAKELYKNSHGHETSNINRKVTLACSIDELISIKAIRDDRTTTRPNPRQRRRMRQQQASRTMQKVSENSIARRNDKPQENIASINETSSHKAHEKKHKKNKNVAVSSNGVKEKEHGRDNGTAGGRKKQSKYRNEAGQRKKKRF